MPTVLVLDANQRSALAVTRSLGRSGRYIVYTGDSVPVAIAGASRFSKAYFRYPDPARQPLEFITWINDIVSQHKFDLVIPVTEVTSQLLLMHESSLPHVNIPFSPYERVMQMADKISLVKSAKKSGVRVPESQFYENAEQVSISKQTFPFVIKPALSRIFRGDHWVQTHVRVVRNPNEWQAALAQAPYLYDSPFMIQEFIPGHGKGVFCLYNRGLPVQFFAHQRLREKPPEGGVSVLCQSVPVDTRLRHAAEALLSAVQWHGVAMVEFRVSETGEPYLMEINTRFWGSLQLAVDAGVDFPLMLADAHLQTRQVKGTDYRFNQRLRWLLGDLDSLYIFLKSSHPYSEKIRRILQFFLIQWKNQKHEINRMNDSKPAIVELRQYLKSMIKK